MKEDLDEILLILRTCKDLRYISEILPHLQELESKRRPRGTSKTTTKKVA
jgi:hypothetical protein